MADPKKTKGLNLVLGDQDWDQAVDEWDLNLDLPLSSAKAAPEGLEEAGASADGNAGESTSIDALSSGSEPVGEALGSLLTTPPLERTPVPGDALPEDEPAPVQAALAPPEPAADEGEAADLPPTVEVPLYDPAFENEATPVSPQPFHRPSPPSHASSPSAEPPPVVSFTADEPELDDEPDFEATRVVALPGEAMARLLDRAEQLAAEGQKEAAPPVRPRSATPGPVPMGPPPRVPARPVPLRPAFELPANLLHDDEPAGPVTREARVPANLEELMRPGGPDPTGGKPRWVTATTQELELESARRFGLPKSDARPGARPPQLDPPPVDDDEFYADIEIERPAEPTAEIVTEWPAEKAAAPAAPPAPGGIEDLFGDLNDDVAPPAPPPPEPPPRMERSVSAAARSDWRAPTTTGAVPSSIVSALARATRDEGGTAPPAVEVKASPPVDTSLDYVDAAFAEFEHGNDFGGPSGLPATPPHGVPNVSAPAAAPQADELNFAEVAAAVAAFEDDDPTSAAVEEPEAPRVIEMEADEPEPINVHSLLDLSNLGIEETPVRGRALPDPGARRGAPPVELSDSGEHPAVGPAYSLPEALSRAAETGAPLSREVVLPPVSFEDLGLPDPAMDLGPLGVDLEPMVERELPMPSSAPLDLALLEHAPDEPLPEGLSLDGGSATVEMPPAPLGPVVSAVSGEAPAPDSLGAAIDDLLFGPPAEPATPAVLPDAPPLRSPVVNEDGRALELNAGYWEVVLASLVEEGTARGDNPEGAATYYQAGRILEQRLGRVDDALVQYEAAYRADPRHLQTLTALRRDHLRRGDVGRAVELLDEELALVSPTERRALLWLRAEIQRWLAEDSSEARKSYVRLIAPEEGETGAGFGLVVDRTALDAIAELAFLEETPEQGAAALRRVVEGCTDSLYVSTLAVEAGRLAEMDGRKDDARQAFELAVEVRADASPAQASLLRLAGAAGDWEGVVRRLGELGAAHAPESTAYLRRQALVLSSRLDRAADAQTALDRAAAGVPVLDPLLIETQVRVALGAGDTWRAANALLSLGSRYGTPALSGAVLVRAGDLFSRGPGTPAPPAPEPGPDGAPAAPPVHHGWPEAGLAYRSALPSGGPSATSARTGLLHLAGRANDGTGTAQLFCDAAAASPAGEATQWLLAGRALERAGQNEAAALRYRDALKAALRTEGGDESAADLAVAGPSLRSLVRLEIGAGRLRELAEVHALVTAAFAADPDEQLELCERELSLWRYRIGDAEQAQLRARKLLELYPEHPTVRLVLGQLLSELGRAAEWSELLEQEAELTSDAQRAAWLWHKQAGLLERDLGDATRALQAYRRSLDGGYAPAGWDVARLSEAQHQFSELTEVYRGALVEAGARGSKRKAAQAAVRLGALLQSELQDGSGALEAYGEALRHLENDLSLWRAMGRVARRSGDPSRLAEAGTRELAVLAALDPQSASPAQLRSRVALLVRMAELQAERLERPEVGVQELQKAAALAPGSVLVRRALVDLHTRGETFSDLAELFLSELREAQSGPQRVRAYERLARLDADHRADEPSAVLAYEAIIEGDPAHLPSLRALERYDLQPGAEREAALVGIYQKLAGVLPAADALALRMELARLRRRIEGETAAREELRAALVLDPRHIPAVLHLESAARQAGDMATLAECYDALADMIDDPVSKALCLHRAGDFLSATGAASAVATTIPRGDDAVTARYRTGAWSAATHLPVQDALVQRALEKRASLASTGVPAVPPEPGVAGPEDVAWRELAEAVEAQAGASRDTQATGTSWLLAGLLWQEKLSDMSRALIALRRACDLRPEDGEAYRRLHKLLLTQGDYLSLVELIGKRAAVESSAPALAAMHRERAHLELERLHRAEDAKLSLRRLLALEPNDQDALTLIGDLYYKDGQYAEAADAFIRRVRITKDPVVLKDLFLKLGIIYDDKLPDMKRAVASFRKVIEFDSRNMEALEKLSQIHLREWEWQGALQATLRLCELTTDNPPRRREYLTRLAKIYEDGLQDPRRALDAYRRALEVDAADIGAIGEVAGFHSRQKDETSLAVHLDQAATLVRSRIAQDPGDPSSYRHLFQIFGWRRAIDATVCTAQLLDAFGQADEGAKELLRRAAGRPQPLPSQLGGTRPGTPSDGTDELLLLPAIGPAQRQLLSMVMETLDKTYAGDLKRYQVGRGDRIAPRSGHHVRELAERLGQALGITEFDIYVCKAQPYVCLVENTSPPSLILGAELVAKSDPVELRFLLGRLLKIIQLGLILPARLPPADLGVLITALGRQHVVDFSPEGVDSAQITVEEKRIAKALPKRIRQEMQPFCYELAGEFKGGVALSRAIHGTASRVGMLAAGSIGPALIALRRMGGDPTAADPAMLVAAVRNAAEVAEMVRFAVSTEHFELRRRLGIAVG